MNNVYIILTKTNTIVARSIRRFTGARYSHASLSLSDDFYPMYSFARKYINFPFIGTMVMEKAGSGVYGKYLSVPCCILKMQVTDKQYNGVKSMIEDMWQSRQFRYNYYGLFYNYFGMNRHYNNRFFCSEFVYHVLYQNGILDLGKPAGLVRPEDFLNSNTQIIYEGNLNDLKTFPVNEGILQQ